MGDVSPMAELGSCHREGQNGDLGRIGNKTSDIDVTYVLDMPLHILWVIQIGYFVIISDITV